MINNHRLENAKQISSPNFNKRPNQAISLIVIHNISLPPGKFNNNHIEDFFTNQLNTSQHPYFKTIKELKVSAHLLIKRNGMIIQFVPFNQRAWHAGESSYKGKYNCNDFSIGIELQGDDNTPYESVQYEALNKVINLLKSHYPISAIKGHSDISPIRKTDPGPYFKWSKLHAIT
ncbi:1,6-anhydro-N-acetylmuramyl-L-alanine amidase AmpD [Candidatus Ruthia endofausta]|uniref:1,6-anhydro-N-acetylmuramyl-L-alanine amidase AmpD n=1 Tax=Candidatus Ruthia endofausta TaxID=2738852 RepID=A0A6N0HQD5_9GAMM|nr:1,6-anhydro-N-acetylmuramyl-L-alanine amidase AmpD [Candidatus Ruthia endofausta]QKQ24545.1 1,6-anhydro-N-acetylmuramyl-L-alanine amidase AmpD [Candidatus Ruthia endofausta]